MGVRGAKYEGANAIFITQDYLSLIVLFLASAPPSLKNADLTGATQTSQGNNMLAPVKPSWLLVAIIAIAILVTFLGIRLAGSAAGLS